MCPIFRPVIRPFLVKNIQAHKRGDQSVGFLSAGPSGARTGFRISDIFEDEQMEYVSVPERSRTMSRIGKILAAGSGKREEAGRVITLATEVLPDCGPWYQSSQTVLKKILCFSAKLNREASGPHNWSCIDRLAGPVFYLGKK